jgi:hypothetical protein
MSRAQRFIAWIIAIALGLTAPIWAIATDHAPRALLIGIIQSITAVGMVIMLVATTTKDAIRISPLANLALLACGALIGQYAARPAFTFIPLALLLALATRVWFDAHQIKKLTPDQRPERAHRLGSCIWSAAPLAWLPTVWAFPQGPLPMDFTHPRLWTTIGILASALACLALGASPKTRGWLPLPYTLWALAIANETAIRITTLATP